MCVVSVGALLGGMGMYSCPWHFSWETIEDTGMSTCPCHPAQFARMESRTGRFRRQIAAGLRRADAGRGLREDRRRRRDRRRRVSDAAVVDASERFDQRPLNPIQVLHRNVALVELPVIQPTLREIAHQAFDLRGARLIEGAR